MKLQYNTTFLRKKVALHQQSAWTTVFGLFFFYFTATMYSMCDWVVARNHYYFSCLYLVYEFRFLCHYYLFEFPKIVIIISLFCLVLQCFTKKYQCGCKFTIEHDKLVVKRVLIYVVMAAFENRKQFSIVATEF